MVKKLIMLFVLLCPYLFIYAQPVSKEEVLIPGSNQSIKMIGLQGGSFTMGSNTSLNQHEKPTRQVQVSPFSIGVYEITHDQFDIFSRMKKYHKDQKQMPLPDQHLNTSILAGTWVKKAVFLPTA